MFHIGVKRPLKPLNQRRATAVRKPPAFATHDRRHYEPDDLLALERRQVFRASLDLNQPDVGRADRNDVEQPERSAGFSADVTGGLKDADRPAFRAATLRLRVHRRVDVSWRSSISHEGARRSPRPPPGDAS